MVEERDIRWKINFAGNVDDDPPPIVSRTPDELWHEQMRRENEMHRRLLEMTDDPVANVVEDEVNAMSREDMERVLEASGPRSREAPNVNPSVPDFAVRLERDVVIIPDSPNENDERMDMQATNELLAEAQAEANGGLGAEVSEASDPRLRGVVSQALRDAHTRMEREMEAALIPELWESEARHRENSRQEIIAELEIEPHNDAVQFRRDRLDAALREGNARLETEAQMLARHRNEELRLQRETRAVQVRAGVRVPVVHARDAENVVQSVSPLTIIAMQEVAEGVVVILADGRRFHVPPDDAHAFPPFALGEPFLDVSNREEYVPTPEKPEDSKPRRRMRR